MKWLMIVAMLCIAPTSFAQSAPAETEKKEPTTPETSALPPPQELLDGLVEVKGGKWNLLKK